MRETSEENAAALMQISKEFKQAHLTDVSSQREESRCNAWLEHQSEIKQDSRKTLNFGELFNKSADLLW